MSLLLLKDSRLQLVCAWLERHARFHACFNRLSRAFSWFSRPTIPEQKAVLVLNLSHGSGRDSARKSLPGDRATERFLIEWFSNSCLLFVLFVTCYMHFPVVTCCFLASILMDQNHCFGFDLHVTNLN